MRERSRALSRARARLIPCLPNPARAAPQSRSVALILASTMALTAVYMHPFWAYLLSSRKFTMEGVSGMEGFEVDAFTMADHQRYFFFQTMSTVGALLLLVVHGPGTLSVDEPDGPMKLSSAKGDA